MNSLPLFTSLTARQTLKAAKQLDHLLEILSDGRWYKGRELCQLLHTDERTLRKMAELADGRLVSTDAGYRLVEYVSAEEITEFEQRHLNQAAKTKHRVMRTLLRWHGRQRSA